MVGIGSIVILFVTMAFRKARNIKPMATPAFAVMRVLQQDASERAQRIQALEKHALKTGETQICIETPYRNQSLWQALLGHLQANTRLCRSSNLSLPEMQTVSKRVADWRKAPGELDKHTPVVFAFGP